MGGMGAWDGIGGASSYSGIGPDAYASIVNTGSTNATNRYLGNLDSQTSLAKTGMEVGSQNYGAQLGYDANMAGVSAQNAKTVAQNSQFQQKYGLLSSALNDLNTGWGSYANGYNGTGSVGGPEPTITAAPVWTQQQINQQVNSQNANVDAQVGSQTRDMQQGLAGRGFGSNSALSNSLAMGYQGQGLQQKMSNQQQTNWNAAQGNAQQLLSSQQAQEQQYANRQQEDIGRHQVVAGRDNAIVAALGGL
jgi:hypothetical protein